MKNGNGDGYSHRTSRSRLEEIILELPKISSSHRVSASSTKEINIPKI